MKLYLVRHGETEWNEGKRIQGQSDTVLSENGRKQAEKVAEALSSQKIDAVYSSPLKRAAATATAIAAKHHLQLNIIPGLMEINAGELDGITIEEMRKNYVDFLKQWREGAESLKMPGGESMEELQQRTSAALEEILRKGYSNGVVIVSHHFALQSIVCYTLRVNISLFRRFRHDLGGITTFEFRDGRAFLLHFNDICHLK